MKYKVFYCLYGQNKYVDGDNAIEMELVDIYTEIFRSLEDEDFFGMIDKNNVTLQVMYSEKLDKYWVEIPSEKEKGSYGAEYGFYEIAKLLRNLPKTFNYKDFEKFKFEPW